MSKKLLLAVILVVVLLGLLIQIVPQLGSGNLIKRFWIQTPSGGWKPLKNLDVELWQGDVLIATGTTGNNGRVIFCPLEDGNYTLIWEYEGVSYEEDVTVEGQTEIDNYLTPRSCGRLYFFRKIYMSLSIRVN